MRDTIDLASFSSKSAIWEHLGHLGSPWGPGLAGWLAEGSELRAEGSELRSQSSELRLRAEVSEMRAEGSELRAEGSELRQG